MNKSDITIKNVKMFEGHDGTVLNADIFVRGKKIAHVYDGAYGGEFEYTPLFKNDSELKENRKILEELQEFVKTLPNVKSDFFPEGLEMNLDMFIDELINEIEKEKGQKKIQKLCDQALVYGKPGENSYRLTDFKRPLKEVVEMKGGRNVLQTHYYKVRTGLKKGEVFYNKNLEALGIKL
jgi:hypothetical protein